MSAFRREVNRLRRLYQRCQTNRRRELQNIYKSIKQKYEKVLIETKTKSWNQFVVDSTRDNAWGLVYKIAKKSLKNEKISELIGINGQTLTGNEAIAGTLLEVLFPRDESTTQTSKHVQIVNRLQVLDTNDDNLSQSEIQFSIQEVTDIVEQQNPNKSPGADGLTSDIIKNIHILNPELLTDLYNKCTELSIFPTIWMQSIVKVIPKPSRHDYTDPNAYRPISLLPVLSKIYEKLIINRLVYYLRKNHLINEKQFGFTAQTSTETALHNTINYIKEGMDKKGFVLVISLDISGAFTYCWPTKVFLQLRDKKCPKNIYKILKSCFIERRAKLWFMNNEYVRDLNIGAPQGSCSGPWLWNICFDDIFNMSDTNVQINGFADDTLIMVYSDNTQELENIANRKLEQIHEWAKDNKLSFNVKKTKVVLLTKRLKYVKPIIRFDNQEQETEKSFKYLGVIIDSKLTLKMHSNYVLAKSSQLVKNLLRFAKTNYGLNEKALEVIYKGSVLPLISYCCSVWAHALDRKYVTEPLIKLQRRVAMRLIKSYKTISTDASNIIANLMPVDLYLKGKDVEYFIKHNINHKLLDEYLSGTDITLDLIMRPIDVRTLRHISERKQITYSNISNIFEIYFSSHKSFETQYREALKAHTLYLKITTNFWLKNIKHPNIVQYFK